jgi:hypothetical protein
MARPTTDQGEPGSTSADSTPAGAGSDDEVMHQVVDSILEAIVAPLRDRLDDEGLKTVRQMTERLAAFGVTVGRYPVENADEPDFTFAAYRSEG